MNRPPPLFLDPQREKEIRQSLAELKRMQMSGYFDGLEGITPDSARPVASLLNPAVEAVRWNALAKRMASLRPLDAPIAPALSQFMTQVGIGDRSMAYKEEARRKFEEARAQVKILFGKLTRREVASAALIRAIVASFLDTFMKDRNLLMNLAAHPYHGADYLYDHSLKMCLLSLALASASGYSRSQSLEIAQGALLADVGMMLVPEAIRLKRGKLSEGELAEMRRHPMLALSLLEPIHGLSEPALVIPYQHHERLSGTGYPDQRAGNLVSRYARIVGIADVFTAMVNTRSYRDAVNPYDAMVNILSMGGQGLLDGEHIRHFLRTLAIFPLGSLVRLKSGRVAKVVAPNDQVFTKPLVTVLSAEDGTPLARDKFHQIDLFASGTEAIVEALGPGAIPNSILDGF